MLNNFIHAKTKSLFLEQLGTGNILDEAVVFIEDTKEIWNRGTFYNCAPLKTDGDGTKFLSDDGEYKEIEVPTKVSELEDDISIVTLNDSTTIKESVDGTELVPIFDGENKAVSVNELIKNSKEVYAIDLDNFKTSEDFNNLKNAINSNKIISINSEIASSFQFGSGDGVEFVSFITSFSGYSIEDPAEFSIGGTKYSFWENGRCDITYFGNITEGDGTKFLSDDGTYKEIIHPEPYILNYSDTPYEISSEELEKLRNAKEVRLNYYTEGGQAGGSGISAAIYNHHYHNYGTDDNIWTFYIDESYDYIHDFVGYIQASVNYDSATSTYVLSFTKLKNVNTYLLTSETYKYSDLEAALDQGKQIIFQMTSDSQPYVVHELDRQSEGIMLGCLVMTTDGIGDALIMCGSDDIMFEPYTQRVITLTGDGNSFLADNGEYKTIGNLELFSFTDGEYIDTDVYSRLSDKISNKIPIVSYINGNYLYSTGGYVGEGLVFIFVDYVKITKVHIYRDYRVSISTYNVTSEINTLNNTIAALEERTTTLEDTIASSGSDNLTEETVQNMIDASITTVLNTEV